MDRREARLRLAARVVARLPGSRAEVWSDVHLPAQLEVYDRARDQGRAPGDEVSAELLWERLVAWLEAESTGDVVVTADQVIDVPLAGHPNDGVLEVLVPRLLVQTDPTRLLAASTALAPASDRVELGYQAVELAIVEVLAEPSPRAVRLLIDGDGVVELDGPDGT